MKMFNKPSTRLLLLATLISGQAITTQVHAAGGDGGPISDPNIGQALVFPYYTVRNGQKSFFNITNITPDTVAVKIRFHESLNSRDALDFVVVLSPYDVWTGLVEEGIGHDNITPTPVVRTTDASCVVGAPNIHDAGQAFSNIGYGNDSLIFADQGTDSIQRTFEGYMVAQVMGVVPDGSEFDDSFAGTVTGTPVAGVLTANAWTGSVAYNAYHVNGLPRNCANVNSAFVAGVNAPTNLPVAHPFADSAYGLGGDGDAAAIAEFSGPASGTMLNQLKGNFSIINSGSGIGAGNSAVAINSFLTLEGIGAGNNYITAQNFPYFLEPTLASGEGIWTTTLLIELEFRLKHLLVNNEWANNPNTGAQADWVITFPTKSFHVDNKDALGVAYVDPFVAPASAVNPEPNIQSAANIWRAGSIALSGSVFENNLNAEGAAVKISLTGYDREELTAVADTGNTTPSPFPPGGVTELVLQGEANVITFAAAGSANKSALSAKNFVLNFDVVATLGNNAPNGWASLKFIDPIVTDAPVFPLNGMPVLGWIYKVRNQGDASLNFGQIMEHGYPEPFVIIK